MILEVAILDIRLGLTQEFEVAFQKAALIIAAMPVLDEVREIYSHLSSHNSPLQLRMGSDFVVEFALFIVYLPSLSTAK